MVSNGNGNGGSHKGILENLFQHKISEEVPGEDISPIVPDNECGCAYSAMMLADNWSTLLHLLGTDSTEAVRQYSKLSRQVGYFAKQVDQKCGITHDNISGEPLPQGLLYNVYSMADNPERFLKKTVEENVPAGKNVLELSEEEAEETLTKAADTLKLALSMMLSDTETMVLRCSRVKPGTE